VSFIIIFGTLSFPVDLVASYAPTSTDQTIVNSVVWWPLGSVLLLLLLRARCGGCVY